MSATVTSPQLDSVRTAVQERLASAPLDFIRGLDQEKHRADIVADYFRALPPESDMRFLFEAPGGVLLAVCCEVLAWDSAFFGYPVAKLHGIFQANSATPGEEHFSLALQALVELATARGVRYLFTSADPRSLGFIRSLSEQRFSLIETRAYYHRSLDDFEAPERYAVRAATIADIPTLSDTAEHMVNRFDRFHADPFIDIKDADRLMREWVRASVASGFADVTIVPDAPKPSAFVTVKYHKGQWDRWNLKLSQPVFGAVSPEFKGWYQKIISEISYHLRAQGAEHIYLVTQVTNGAVIKAWERMKYSFGKNEHVFRRILDLPTAVKTPE